MTSGAGGRRRRLPLLLALTLALAALLLLLGRALSTPEEFDPPGAAQLVPEQVEQSARFERNLAAELTRVREDEAPWGVRIREDSLNDWLWFRLPDWIAHLEGEGAPGTKSMLQARITPESIRLSTDRLVVSLRPRVEDGTLVLVPASGTRIGRLPVPTALFRGFVDSIDLDGLLERLPASEGPAPEAAGAVRLGATFPLGDGRAVELLEVQLQSSEAVLVFRTVRDGAAGEIRD